MCEKEGDEQNRHDPGSNQDRNAENALKRRSILTDIGAPERITRHEPLGFPDDVPFDLPEEQPDHVIVPDNEPVPAKN